MFEEFGHAEQLVVFEAKLEGEGDGRVGVVGVFRLLEQQKGFLCFFSGKMAKILEYCRSDVAITRDLYRFGKEKRYLLFQNKAKQTVRLPVDW